MFKGTCIRDIFKEFIIKQVLPVCNLYPGPRLVIIIDNVLVYYSNKERIKKVAKRHRV